jgi:hypothetical protein
MRKTEYYIVGDRPVKFVPLPEGGLSIRKMNWQTGIFEYGIEYLARASSSDSDVDHVSEQEFIQHVEKIRARRLKGEGPIFALYQTMNAMVDTAKAQGRQLTGEERELVAELRRQTYEMFQNEYPDDTSIPPRPAAAQ